MKKLLFLLCFLSTSAFAIDKPIPCTGNSCKLLFETTGSGGAKVSAGNVDGTGVLNLNVGMSLLGGSSIRQVSPQVIAVTTDGGNSYANVSLSTAALNSAKVSCTANYSDSGASYLGAAIACAMVDTSTCRCRVTGRTTGNINVLMIEWL